MLFLPNEDSGFKKSFKIYFPLFFFVNIVCRAKMNCSVFYFLRKLIVIISVTIFNI